MAIASWKPGTSRWAYLITGVYAVAFAAGLPITIVVNDDPAWLIFSCAMPGGVDERRRVRPRPRRVASNDVRRPRFTRLPE